MHLHKAREIKYQFIFDYSSIFHVGKMCEVFDINKSAYYAWLKRPPSERKKEDNILSVEIKRISKESYGTYGARRIKEQLKKDVFQCCKTRVSRLMKENNVESKLKRKYKATTYSDHNFNVAPREVVGWSMDSTMTRKLVIDAFNSAMLKDRPAEDFIFHSDRGVQYASYDYQDLLREHGCIQSISAKGCCYDNACAESFFSSLKKDMLYGRKFKTRAEAKQAIVEYIELFYNPKRLHSTLGYKSPREFKELYYANLEDVA